MHFMKKQYKSIIITYNSHTLCEHNLHILTYQQIKNNNNNKKIQKRPTLLMVTLIRISQKRKMKNVASDPQDDLFHLNTDI